MAKRELDDVTGTETTGHEWDGIRELDTPMPRWWLWTYAACVIFAVGYVIAYPAIPLIHGATPGLLGYTSRGALQQEVADARLAQSAQLDKIKSLSLEEIRKDPKLLQFAVAGGKAAFSLNCIQCHGSGAAGGKGYPTSMMMIGCGVERLTRFTLHCSMAFATRQTVTRGNPSCRLSGRMAF